MQKQQLNHKIVATKKSIVSDNLENKIGYHPIVILNSEDGTVYYVKCVSYYMNMYKNENDVSINVKDIKKPQQIITHRSLIDTTKIYMMNHTEFKSYFSNNTLHISDIYTIKMKEIYQSILKNLNQQPPLISLIKTTKISLKQLLFNSLYVNETLINQDLKNIENNDLMDSNLKEKYYQKIDEIINIRNHDENTLDLIENIKLWIIERINDINMYIYKTIKQKDDKEYE